MKNLWIVLLSALIILPFTVFSQYYSHNKTSKYDTVAYIPPSFPDGYAAIIPYIEKNVVYADKSTIMKNNTLYDAVITLTLNGAGSIVEFNHKGAIVDGIVPAMQNCFTNMPQWNPGKKNNKNISTVVQLTFSYNINTDGIKIVNLNPVYSYYLVDKDKKTVQTLIAIIGVLTLCFIVSRYF